MRRIALLATVVALVCLALSSLGARPAQAGWSGGPGNTGEPLGGWPTREQGCTSWQPFIGPYLYWTPWPGNEVACYGGSPASPVSAAIAPICSGGMIEDNSEPSGCRPPNSVPLWKELGCDCPLSGNPISLAGGNKFQTVTDFETATPDKLGFTRYYNSGNAFTSKTALGYGWRSAFDTGIDTTNSAGWVYVFRPDGQIVEMDVAGGAWFAHEADVDLKLTQTGSGVGAIWVLTDPDDTAWTFTQISSSVASLTSIKKRGGYTQTLHYNASNQLTSVSDSYGRQMLFTLQNGLISAITAPDGGVYQYLYQTSSAGHFQQLVGVVKPGDAPTAPSEAYVYENASFPAALTGIVDGNGTRFATYGYEQWGRPTTTQHGAADLYGVAFTDATNVRTVTGPLGLQETYQFATVQQARKVTRIDRAATASTPAAFSTSSYDGHGYLSSTTDWNGVVTNRSNDARGLPLSITTAAGTPQARTVTYTWDSVYHLPTQIVEPGRTTTFTYAGGLLMTKTETDTTTATVPYSTHGRTRTWTYTYTPTGLVQTVKGPRTDVIDTVTYGYDASGTLVSVTNALGQETQVTAHDGAGRPTTVVDANGVTTNMTYTPQGWLNTVTVVSAGGNAVTTIDHDAAGQVTRITSPDGAFLSYSYDGAHRLVRVSDAFDERIDYTLAMGGRTQEQISTAGGVAVAKTQSRVFDVLGRLLQGIGAASQTTSFGYDNDGNLTQITDPLTRVRGQSFDALNRLIQVAAPLSSTTGYGYDAHDNRTSVTDPRGLVTSYIYDGLDNLIQVTSPDTGTTVYVVDDAGNRIQQTDAAGVVLQMSYDALNRLMAKTYPADPAENVTYRYDEPSAGFGIARLTSVSDTSGSTAYVYDARGNVVQETHVIGGQSYITSYAYELADRVAQITYPSGRIVSYG